MASSDSRERLPKVKLPLSNRICWMLFQASLFLWMNAPIWQDCRVRAQLDCPDLMIFWAVVTGGVTLVATYFLVWLGSHVQRYVHFPHVPERFLAITWAFMVVYFLNPTWLPFWALLSLLLFLPLRRGRPHA